METSNKLTRESKDRKPFVCFEQKMSKSYLSTTWNYENAEGIKTGAFNTSFTLYDAKC